MNQSTFLRFVFFSTVVGWAVTIQAEPNTHGNQSRPVLDPNKQGFGGPAANSMPFYFPEASPATPADSASAEEAYNQLLEKIIESGKKLGRNITFHNGNSGSLCQATQIAACVFATAKHCGGRSGGLRSVSIAGIGGRVTLNYRSDARLDSAILYGKCPPNNVPIVPVCEKPPQGGQAAFWDSRWWKGLFRAVIRRPDYIGATTISVNPRQGARVRQGDSGGGFFVKQGGKVCYAGNLSTSDMRATTRGGSYIGNYVSGPRALGFFRGWAARFQRSNEDSRVAQAPRKEEPTVPVPVPNHTVLSSLDSVN